MAAKRWGLQPRVMLWLYKAVILPSLSHGVVVWWPRLLLRTTQTLLGRLHRLVLLCITGAFSGTPTAAMGAALAIPPLHDLLLGSALSTAIRLKAADSWQDRPYRGHAQLLTKYRTELPVIGMPNDFLRPKYSFDRRYSITILSRQHWSAQPLRSQADAKDLQCYTDGSRLGERGAGAGYVLIHRGVLVARLGVSLDKYATVFQAEILAISEAAERASRFLGFFPGAINSVTFYSDSSAALLALASCVLTSKMVRDCHSRLQKLANNCLVNLNWIPGHRGFEFNELADQEAKTAAGRTTYHPSPILPLSIQSSRRHLDEWLKNRHTTAWDQQTDCRQARMLVPRVNHRVARQLLRMPRQKLRLTIGLLTGHCIVRRHLHLMRLVPRATCSFCRMADEDVFHFLADCPTWMTQRSRILGGPSLTLEQLRRATVNQLVSFAELTKRFCES